MADLDLLDYEEEYPSGVVEVKKEVTNSYGSIYRSRFQDFLLRPEILKAIVDCGFENTTQVQHEGIPQAVLGMDIICQAKSGMGKTTLFVLSTLQQLEIIDGQVSVLVVCHSRELAFEIKKQYERLCKYMTDVKVAVFFGGMPIIKDEETLNGNCPNIVIGTPGRVLALTKNKKVHFQHVNHFILDECDQILEQLDMRRNVQEIFKNTPTAKQVMMFSSTLPEEMRLVCRSLTYNPLEVFSDDDAKHTLHGLNQHYTKLKEINKVKILIDLLNVLKFDQIIIFVNSTLKCMNLVQFLNDRSFPAIGIHTGIRQEQRLVMCQSFKDFEQKILVTTDVFGKGMNNAGVDIVINFDVPENSNIYLHRVAQALKFSSKGMAISFVSDEKDEKFLNDVQTRFDLQITGLPDEIDQSILYGKMMNLFVD